jgi:hypothetical protein
MLCVGLEPTIPVSERAKTVHALDHSATVTGTCYLIRPKSLILPTDFRIIDFRADNAERIPTNAFNLLLQHLTKPSRLT